MFLQTGDLILRAVSLALPSLAGIPGRHTERSHQHRVQPPRPDVVQQTVGRLCRRRERPQGRVRELDVHTLRRKQRLAGRAERRKREE